MVRVLAFARHASGDIVVGKGLSADDEPDLWQRILTGTNRAVESDVGLPRRKARAARPLAVPGRWSSTAMAAVAPTSGDQNRAS